MILLENKMVRLEFDPIVPCVCWTPLDFMNGEQFRQPFAIGMDFLTEKIKEMPNLGWLNDTRQLRPVKPDDVKWLDLNVNDRAYKIGVKKVAFVLPEYVFGRLATRFYIDFTTKRLDNKLEIKAFKTVSEAKLWLKGAQGYKVDEIKL